jgi:CubicO group peptidase (beta-lactamase class C family)
MTRTALRVAALLAAAGAPAGAQERPAEAPQVDSVFAAFDRTSGPGCAVGVSRAGRVAYARGYGMADLGHGLAITPGTVFYIASTSKQFAAFAVALLAEDGRLGLDDPVRKWVPELPAWADGIAVRHLVHHTSGIRDYLTLWSLSGRSVGDEVPEAVALDLIARQQATDFAPGARYSYSNSGYFLLSVIVARASGRSLRDFAAERMFGPLGMTGTGFHDDRRRIVPRRAEGYEPDGRGGHRLVRTSFALVGDGGLLSTVEDLLRWERNFSANRLGAGGDALVRLVTTPGRLAGGQPLDYAFGLIVGEHRGLPTVRHGGSFIGFRAELLRFPQQELAVAVLCNEATADAGGLAERVAAVYLGDRMEPRPAIGPGVPVAGAVLDGWVGRYEVVPGVVAEVTRRGDGLALGVAGAPATDLVARSDSTFVAGAWATSLVFRRTAAGPALVFGGAGAEPALRLPDAVTHPGAELAAFEGRYDSPELDSWFTVRRQDGGLALRARLGAWVPLRAIRPGEFVMPGARVTFIRGAGGRVAGIEFASGRARGIRAVRAGR